MSDLIVYVLDDNLRTIFRRAHKREQEKLLDGKLAEKDRLFHWKISGSVYEMGATKKTLSWLRKTQLLINDGASNKGSYHKLRVYTKKWFDLRKVPEDIFHVSNQMYTSETSAKAFDNALKIYSKENNKNIEEQKEQWTKPILSVTCKWRW